MLHHFLTPHSSKQPVAVGDHDKNHAHKGSMAQWVEYRSSLGNSWLQKSITSVLIQFVLAE